MYVIEGTEKAMLIDTGTDCEKLDEVVRNITKKPLYVVITHIHLDHAGNIKYFDDIYFHAADTVLLNRLKPYKGRIHFVKDGDVFDLGNREIEVKHMPGHTPGSIVLSDRKWENCYTGDAFGSGEVWLQVKPLTPLKTYIASCQKMDSLMNKGITRIYCGHYPHQNKALDKSYLTSMWKLAEALYKGEVQPRPYHIKVSIGPENPMIVTNGKASIVYDPEILKP
jgi:glyoxylase-like metal-dependent hydrolase (beta-lactamase superfamily II)